MRLLVFSLPFVLIQSVVCNVTREAIKRDLKINQRDAGETMIVTYKQAKMSQIAIKKEHKRLKLVCRCHVEHLSNVGAFILSYDGKTQTFAKSLKLDHSKEIGIADEVVTIFNTEFTHEQSEDLMDVENGWTLNDPHFHSQWALANLDNDADINVQDGWTEYLLDTIGSSNNGPEVVVAVIDTGVDYNHPELKGMMWNNPGEIPNNGIDDDRNGIVDDVFGADFTGKRYNGDPIDKYGHGTHCAGIIGAKENNGIGIAGVASFAQHKVKIMAIKGITDGGSGRLSRLLMSLNYAIGHGAKISSNSWGSNSSISEKAEEAWSNVLQNNPDHLFVASAGNDNHLVDINNRRWSCGLKEPNLLCVASSTKDGAKSSFSNYGKDNVHVFAPGSSIISTLPNNRYGPASGTSMACPHVSGLAALLLTMRCDLKGQHIKQLIEENVRKKSRHEHFVSSGGIIDVAKTIRALKTSDTFQGTPSIIKNFVSCIVGYNSKPNWWSDVLIAKNRINWDTEDYALSQDYVNFVEYDDVDEEAKAHMNNQVYTSERRYDLGTNHILGNKQLLQSGQHLTSRNGKYILRLQNDGNLVLHKCLNTFCSGLRGRKTIWESGTSKKERGPFNLAIQHDNRLVITDKNSKPIWWNNVSFGRYGTQWAQGAYAILQNNGNFVIYDGRHQAMWDTATYDGKKGIYVRGRKHRLNSF